MYYVVKRKMNKLELELELDYMSEASTGKRKIRYIKIHYHYDISNSASLGSFETGYSRIAKLMNCTHVIHELYCIRLLIGYLISC